MILETSVENRVRRLARQMGYHVRKNPDRQGGRRPVHYKDPRTGEFVTVRVPTRKGGYELSQIAGVIVLGSSLDCEYSATLDDIETYLDSAQSWELGVMIEQLRLPPDKRKPYMVEQVAEIIWHDPRLGYRTRREGVLRVG